MMKIFEKKNLDILQTMMKDDKFLNVMTMSDRK